MKRIIFALMFSAIFFSLHAQEKYTVYCDVYLFGERGIWKNATLSFDFGDNRNVDLLDENGKRMKFPSPITAVNYLSKKGWKLFSVTSSTNNDMSILTKDIGITVLVMHYIMTKDVSSDAEILNGLKTSLKDKKEKKEKKMSDDGYMY